MFRPKFGKDYTKPEAWNALNFSENDETEQSEDFSELETAQDEIENHHFTSVKKGQLFSDQTPHYSKKRKYKRVYIESSDDDENVSILSEPAQRKNKAKKRKYSSQKMVSDSSSDNCESPRSQSKEFNFFIYEPIILGRFKQKFLTVCDCDSNESDDDKLCGRHRRLKEKFNFDSEIESDGSEIRISNPFIMDEVFTLSPS